MALSKAVEGFPFVLAEQDSPLRRRHVSDEELQAGKEHNVAVAASRIDGIVIAPGQVFSFHHAVGRPSRWHGFRIGLELHAGEQSRGLGGGICQVSNLLYLLALKAGLEIVERHRHALDLFPDHGRTVPFGCGATVFYNTSDLRFRNPGPEDVAVYLGVVDGKLVGSIRSRSALSVSVELYEVGHRFERDGEAWWRENHVRRRFIDAAGATVRDEEVAYNRGRCLYDPENPND